MRTLIKIISTAIIILAFIFGAFVAWKIIDNIRYSVRQDLQESFSESLKQYGKR